MSGTSNCNYTRSVCFILHSVNRNTSAFFGEKTTYKKLEAQKWPSCVHWHLADIFIHILWYGELISIYKPQIFTELINGNTCTTYNVILMQKYPTKHPTQN